MTAPQMPIAAFSFSAGKEARSRPSAAGISSAPKRPCSTRKATTSETLPRRPMAAGGGGEADDADEEGLPVAEAVAELAGGDQRDGEGEQIAVGDPLDVGERGAQVLLDGRVGDGDDRAVQGDHRDADGDGDEGQPGVAAKPVAGAPICPSRADPAPSSLARLVWVLMTRG